jgi:hypothetical protein
MGIASVETVVELRGKRGGFVMTRCWVVSRIGQSQLKDRLSGCHGPIRPSGCLRCSAAFCQPSPSRTPIATLAKPTTTCRLADCQRTDDTGHLSRTPPCRISSSQQTYWTTSPTTSTTTQRLSSSVASPPNRGSPAPENTFSPISSSSPTRVCSHGRRHFQTLQPLLRATPKL